MATNTQSVSEAQDNMVELLINGNFKILVLPNASYMISKTKWTKEHSTLILKTALGW